MNTHAITAATLGRLRDVLDQPTPAGFTTGLKALFRWAEQPGRIVPVSATLTALIAETAELLGDQTRWIEDAYVSARSSATTESVLDVLVASEGSGDYTAFVPMLLDNAFRDGISLRELLAGPPAPRGRDERARRTLTAGLDAGAGSSLRLEGGSSHEEPPFRHAGRTSRLGGTRTTDRRPSAARRGVTPTPTGHTRRRLSKATQGRQAGQGPGREDAACG